MKYENVQMLSKSEAIEKLKSGDVTTICETLVSLAFHEADWKWVENRCLEYILNPNTEIKGAAVVCLGHLVRIYGQLHLDKVLPLLEEIAKDDDLKDKVENTLSDIEMFYGNKQK